MKTEAAEGLVAILSEPSSFRDALEHELSRSDVAVYTAESWQDGRKLQTRLRGCITILDEDLPGLPDGGWQAGLPTLDRGRGYVFIMCDRIPESESVGEALKAGALGFLSREAPFDENLFRVHACIEGRAPSQFMASPRARIVGAVQIARAGDTGPPQSGMILNLSRTGILVGAVSLPEVGSEVSLRIELPARGTPICAVGRIVWLGDDKLGSSPIRAGINFDELGDGDAELISRYVLGRLGATSR